MRLRYSYLVSGLCLTLFAMILGMCTDSGTIKTKMIPATTAAPLIVTQSPLNTSIPTDATPFLQPPSTAQPTIVPVYRSETPTVTSYSVPTHTTVSVCAHPGFYVERNITKCSGMICPNPGDLVIISGSNSDYYRQR